MSPSSPSSSPPLPSEISHPPASELQLWQRDADTANCLNNRPFMIACNAMMILPCPPPPTLHQPPQLHRNVVQQVTLLLLLPAAATTIPTTATTSPVLPPSQPKPLFPK
ncbi:unnamed protein product [Pleuronectes platessa]|uniref:Uncharacterized protein n=1 Tax=Pleuronectes platessa TaxID=8262 RepID=A0A9N7UDN1_PLEPL|nr:unnamed protein product [Pleuronectes platessa]